MFWKKKDQLALPKPGFNAASGLRGNFAMARFGNTCRTLSLRHPEGDNLAAYRQIAWLGPNAGWRVLEISEQLPETKLPPQSKIKADNLDFLSAIENIAEWQTGQIKLGFTADEQEAEKLGISYYVPFGERECLAFDIHNQPHVTANGVIITEGYFTEGMRGKIRENFGKPALVASPGNLLTGMFASGPVPQSGDLDNIMKRMLNYAAMDDLRHAFAEMNQVLIYLFEYNLKEAFYSDNWNMLAINGEAFSRANRLSRYDQDKPAHIAVTYLGRTINHCDNPDAYMKFRIKTCQTIVNTLRDSGTIDKQEQQALERMCASYNIIFKTMAAQYLTGYAQENPSEKEEYMKNAAEYIEAAEAEMRENQISDIWQVKAYALRDGTPALPQFFKDFVEQFSNTVDLYNEQTQSDKRRALVARSFQPPPNPNTR